MVTFAASRSACPSACVARAFAISDDGCGFEISSAANPVDVGSGLQNMKNRAAIIGGTFRITSSREKGTDINIIIPTSDL